MLQISALYDAKHARDVPAEKSFSESNFVRKSLKFWVRLPVCIPRSKHYLLSCWNKDIAEVICMIIPHLPIYHYKGKEAKVPLRIAGRWCLLLWLQSVGSPITSIYFDTPDFYCLAEDTRVTLASGVSMRIADLKGLPQVPTCVQCLPHSPAGALAGRGSSVRANAAKRFPASPRARVHRASVQRRSHPCLHSGSPNQNSRRVAAR